ncbi:SIS domain-containing protein [Ornithinicoccus halotolerans]|uniref:SIS domain-containing protein n=1 Tax=Ornithinicoccus halotolerans TaxID=1748220 RepID=UPI002B1FAA4B|nr:SIS domain-containing protein [Ornithinicoccus halotolerans]
MSGGAGPGGTPARGTLMAAEVAEQPSVWRRILEDGVPAACEASRRVAQAAPRFVQLAARGTSDHAATYAKYLAEIEHGLPCGLVSPSTMTVYRARPRLADVLHIAVSQSGGSPDLVHSVQVAREQGALTLAVTNDPDSPLATEAELHLDVLAGPERSVAATKTYTAQLLTLHLLFACLDRDGRPPHPQHLAVLRQLPAMAEELLGREGEVAAAAQRYRFAQRLVTTGRGYGYPTAAEAALKLMETCYLSAQAFSGADLLHGPLAMVDPQVPVIAVVPEGPAGDSMGPVLERLRERGADIYGVGSADAVAGTTLGIELPGGVPGPLSPMLEILPLQQLALHTALARGEDPDSPRGLRKVTETL